MMLFQFVIEKRPGNRKQKVTVMAVFLHFDQDVSRNGVNVPGSSDVQDSNSIAAVDQ
jgi:hypothetical protein